MACTQVLAIVGDRIEATLSGPTKDDRENWEGLCGEAVAALCSEEAHAAAEAAGEEPLPKIDVKGAFKRVPEPLTLIDGWHADGMLMAC